MNTLKSSALAILASVLGDSFTSAAAEVGKKAVFLVTNNSSILGLQRLIYHTNYRVNVVNSNTEGIPTREAA